MFVIILRLLMNIQTLIHEVTSLTSVFIRLKPGAVPFPE